ncbi:hypothetical protein AEM51_03985 [Bacteroidetes bacterium UKL13-3]|nr:hypothetical protein AEM51_03985 [Bacteroidetes bacterium UKL13-3]
MNKQLPKFQLLLSFTLHPTLFKDQQLESSHRSSFHIPTFILSKLQASLTLVVYFLFQLNYKSN